MHTRTAIHSTSDARHGSFALDLRGGVLLLVLMALAFSALWPSPAFATHILSGDVRNSRGNALNSVTVLMINSSNGNTDVTGRTNPAGAFGLAVNYGNSFNCASHYVELVVDGSRDGGEYEIRRFPGLSLWHTGHLGVCYDHDRAMGHIVLRDICPPKPPVFSLPPNSKQGWNDHPVENVLIAGRDDGVGVVKYHYQIANGSPDAWEIRSDWVPEVWDQIDLYEGLHWMRAMTFDWDGNSSDWSNIVEVHVDLTKPMTFVEDVDPTPGGSVLLTAVDNLCYPKTYWRIGETGDWQEGPHVTLPTTPGPVTLYYYAVDLAGNTEATSSFAVTVAEPVKPQVSLTRVTSWKQLTRNKTYVARGFVQPWHA